MLYSLIKNEYYKLFKKKKIYIFTLIIIAMAFIPVIINKIEDAGITFTVNTLPLENLSWSTEMIIPIFVAILVADLITTEYNEGTMKLSLVSSASRLELLTAKIITLISVIILLVIFTMMISYLSGALFLEWGIPFQFNDLTLTETQGILYTIGLYLLSVVPLSAFGVLIMFLGFKLKSGGSVVGLTIGIFFLMNILRQISTLFRPFVLSNYFNTAYLLSSHGLSNKIVVLTIISAVYFLVFLGLSISDLVMKDIVK
ncbi:MAG TPA: ABC transporter permease [Halanaerobiales bacterium]|nr:ABC transporter permease [Halanaerobiales bacterium]